MKQKWQIFILISILFIVFLGGCKLSPTTPAAQIALTATETPTDWIEEAVTETNSSTMTPTTTATHTPTPKPTDTPQPTNTPENDTWNRYLPRTMAEIITLINTEGELDTLVENELYLETNPDYQRPSSVQMIYSGEFHEVIDPRKTMINVWLGTVASQMAASAREELFETEALFTENGQEYWLPIQKPLVKIMEEELKPGDEVTLLLIWIGATKIESETDYVFMVNAFK